MSASELAFVDVSVCPVCRSDKASELDEVEDTLVPELNRHLPAIERPLAPIRNRRVTCNTCGLVYLSPRLSAASLREVYRLWYGYAYRAIFQDDRHRSDREREFRDHHLRVLEQECASPGRLLDIGCGSGLFLSLAQQKGWQAVGIELDGDTAAWASSKYGVEVRTGTLNSCLEANERFDAVTMFDYLEHTDRPAQDLAEVARHVKPGGLLLIRVPNQAGWQSRLMGRRWLGVISNHLTYFSATSLKPALEANGFTDIRFTAHNYRSQLDILAQRASWLKSRLSELATKPTVATPDADLVRPPTATRSSGTLRPVHLAGRLFHSMFIEQVDHVGGWFGNGNFLMSIARKR